MAIGDAITKLLEWSASTSQAPLDSAAFKDNVYTAALETAMSISMGVTEAKAHGALVLSLVSAAFLAGHQSSEAAFLANILEVARDDDDDNR